MTIRVLVLALVLVLAPAEQDLNALQKLFKLLKDLKKDVIEDRDAEQTKYESFACNCKTQTESKNGTIFTQADNIDSYEARINAASAEKAQKQEDYKSALAKREQAKADLAEENQNWKVEDAEFQRRITEASNTLEFITRAEANLADSGNDQGGNLQACQSLIQMVKHPLVDKLKQALHLLQVAPSNDEKYLDKSATSGTDGISAIEDILTELKTEVSKDKTLEEGNQRKAESAHDKLVLKFETTRDKSKEQVENRKAKIRSLTLEIATKRDLLNDAHVTMTNDENFLRDLTAACESRAVEFDQRSGAMNAEISKLSEVMGVLQPHINNEGRSRNGTSGSIGACVDSMVIDGNYSDSNGDIGQEAPCTQDVEESATQSRFLQLGSVSHHADRDGEKREAALIMLGRSAVQLRSAVLSSLVMSTSKDHFANLKKLIQELITRLLKEEAEEIQKEAYCTKEIGMINVNLENYLKDYVRLSDSYQSNAMEIELLKKALIHASVETTVSEKKVTMLKYQRCIDRAYNLCQIHQTEPTIVALQDVKEQLRLHYAKQGSEYALVQKESPLASVDMDGDGGEYGDSGDQGRYQGQQDDAGGIVGMIEVLEDDFKNDLQKVKDAEVEQHDAFFAVYVRENNIIKGFATELTYKRAKLAERNADETSLGIEMYKGKNTWEWTTLNRESLNGMCFNTGMTPREISEKRRAEITALVTACGQLVEAGNTNDCEADYDGDDIDTVYPTTTP